MAVEFELVSVKTLCEMFDLKEETVRGWVKKREIPYHKLGRLVRFKLTEIRSWITARLVKPVNAI